MDCEQLLALIHHYLDGGLSQWRHRAATKHIVECPPCAVEHRFHVHYREVVATKCTEDLPFTVRSRICEALVSADAGGHLAGMGRPGMERSGIGDVGELDLQREHPREGDTPR